MALFHQVKCQRCDAVYSSSRKRCPKCGAKQGESAAAPVKGSGAELIAGIVVLAVIVVATVLLLTSSLKNTQIQGKDRPAKSAAPSSSASAAPSASPSEAPVETYAPTFEPTVEPTVAPTAAPAITEIELNRSDFTLSKIGETFQMTATLYPLGSDVSIIWISEDENVATIDDSGLVTAVDKGNVIISATAGGVTKECIVRVTARAPQGQAGTTTKTPTGSVSLSHGDVTLRASDENNRTFTLKVSGNTDGSTVTFLSEDPNIAEVDSNGVVTAVGKGNTIIAAIVKDAAGAATELKCIVRVAG